MNLLNFINDTLNNGGASYNLLTGEYNPNNGYMVAIKGKELKVPVDQFNRKTVADYISEHTHILLTNLNGDIFLGAWVNEGFVKVDFDTINKESAIKMYYDWCNNFLRIETFAEYYSLHVWQAEKIISLGRKLSS